MNTIRILNKKGSEHLGYPKRLTFWEYILVILDKTAQLTPK